MFPAPQVFPQQTGMSGGFATPKNHPMVMIYSNHMYLVVLYLTVFWPEVLDDFPLLFRESRAREGEILFFHLNRKSFCYTRVYFECISPFGTALWPLGSHLIFRDTTFLISRAYSGPQGSCNKVENVGQGSKLNSQPWCQFPVEFLPWGNVGKESWPLWGGQAGLHEVPEIPG